MNLLVDYDELSAALPSPPDPTVADLALTRASGLIRGISGQTITFVSQETVVRAGGSGGLTLPQRPVVVDDVNPLTVVELGDFGAADRVLTEGRDFNRLGATLTRAGIWARRVQVTYSHGLLTVPAEITSLALDIATALVSNPTKLRSWTTPEYSETYATEMLGAVTVKAIKEQLADLGYRRSRGAFTIIPG